LSAKGGRGYEESPLRNFENLSITLSPNESNKNAVLLTKNPFHLKHTDES